MNTLPAGLTLAPPSLDLSGVSSSHTCLTRPNGIGISRPDFSSCELANRWLISGGTRNSSHYFSCVPAALVRSALLAVGLFFPKPLDVLRPSWTSYSLERSSLGGSTRPRPRFSWHRKGSRNSTANCDSYEIRLWFSRRTDLRTNVGKSGPMLVDKGECD